MEKNSQKCQYFVCFLVKHHCRGDLSEARDREIVIIWRNEDKTWQNHAKLCKHKVLLFIRANSSFTYICILHTLRYTYAPFPCHPSPICETALLNDVASLLVFMVMPHGPIEEKEPPPRTPPQPPPPPPHDVASLLIFVVMPHGPIEEK